MYFLLLEKAPRCEAGGGSPNFFFLGFIYHFFEIHCVEFPFFFFAFCVSQEQAAKKNPPLKGPKLFK